MKKFLVVCVLILVSVSFVFAEPDSKTYLGLSGGINILSGNGVIAGNTPDYIGYDNALYTSTSVGLTIIAPVFRGHVSEWKMYGLLEYGRPFGISFDSKKIDTEIADVSIAQFELGPVYNFYNANNFTLFAGGAIAGTLYLGSTEFSALLGFGPVFQGMYFFNDMFYAQASITALFSPLEYYYGEILTATNFSITPRIGIGIKY